MVTGGNRDWYHLWRWQRWIWILVTVSTNFAFEAVYLPLGFVDLVHRIDLLSVLTIILWNILRHQEGLQLEENRLDRVGRSPTGLIAFGVVVVSEHVQAHPLSIHVWMRK